MTNILLVSTVDEPQHAVRDAIDESASVKIVVPVVKQGILDWLANDQRAFADAATVAKHAAIAVPGDTVDAAAGEANVELAIRDALATFPADEIIVVVRPEDEAGLVESLSTAGLPERTIDGIPVRTLIAHD
jgi:hypothetical protein